MAVRRLLAFSTVLPLLDGPAFAEPVQPAASPTVLHLTQPAERRLPRDLLRVELRAERTAADPRAVQAMVNTAMANALTEARRVAEIDIATGSYTVYREAPAKTGPAQWSGLELLSLTGADPGILLDLAGRLQAQGLVMANLVYEVSPKTLRETEDALTAEALAALQHRAAAIAGQLHLTVTGYRDLTVGNAQAEGGGPRPLMAARAEAAMPPPAAAPGEATVRVTVNADIVLGPTRP